MLELRHIDLSYNRGTPNEVQLFEDFNLKVESGQFVSIVGSNGSGKTSLLNLLSGRFRPQKGEILIDGEDVTKQAEHLHYRSLSRVFQDPSAGTSPSLTLLQNLALAEHKGQRYGLRPGVSRERMDDYRSQLAAFGLGLENRLNDKVITLSGGQRQAVALLMATMTPIKILLLDEHTAALDPKTAEVIMQLTHQIIREKKLTALMVTHNLRYSLRYGDRILMMHGGKILLDANGEAKKVLQLDDLLSRFYAISIEAGNSI